MEAAHDNDLPDLFLRTARRIRRNQAIRLAPLGLSPGQARALRIIGRADAPLRMTTLAERLDVVPRSATTVVDALENAGLVTRAPDPASRRAVLVTLTPEGSGVLRRMADARREAAEELFATLSPAERDTLRNLLGTLNESAPASCPARRSPHGADIR